MQQCHPKKNISLLTLLTGLPRFNALVWDEPMNSRLYAEFGFRNQRHHFIVRCERNFDS